MYVLILSAQQLLEMPAFLSLSVWDQGHLNMRFNQHAFYITNMIFTHFFLISIHIMLWIDSPSTFPCKRLHNHSIVLIFYRFNEVGRFFP